MNRSAFALAITLILLALIAVIVVAYLSSTKIERSTSSVYANRLRAEITAESGLAAAIHVLRDNTRYGNTSPQCRRHRRRLRPERHQVPRLSEQKSIGPLTARAVQQRQTTIFNSAMPEVRFWFLSLRLLPRPRRFPRSTRDPRRRWCLRPPRRHHSPHLLSQPESSTRRRATTTAGFPNSCRKQLQLQSKRPHRFEQ